MSKTTLNSTNESVIDVNGDGINDFIVIVERFNTILIISITEKDGNQLIGRNDLPFPQLIGNLISSALLD